jgi:FkbM family methyltransferase
VATLTSRVVRFVYDRRRLFQRLIPRDSVIPVRLDGFTLLVRADDWAVGMRIAVKRSYEPHVTRQFLAALRPGMTVVDVGANVGWFTMLAASKVGPGGRVIAFEAGRANVELLRRTIARNGFGNVTLHHQAVSDSSGVMRYCADDSNGFVVPGAAPGALPVEGVRLDDALSGEPRIDLIKMDIEGSEGRALVGMREVLRRHRPLVLSEFSPAQTRRASAMEPREVLAEFRTAGYELHVVFRDGSLSEALSDDAILGHVSAEGFENHIDLLARPRLEP